MAKSMSKSIVVVCDDSREDRKALLSHLQGLGMVIEAKDRQELIDSMAAFETDVVILDVCLGDDNGFDVAKEIRERHPNKYIIFVSGVRRDSFYPIKALYSGGADYLSKYNLKELRQKVEEGINYSISLSQVKEYLNECAG